MQRKLGSYLFASGDRPSARTVFDDRIADVDSLCENDLKDLYKVLMQENIKLKYTNHALLSELEQLKKENINLEDRITPLHSMAASNHLIAEQYSALRRNVKLLQDQNEQLRKEIAELKAMSEEYDRRFTLLEARDKPITVREVIRILEHCICFEAVGKSFTKFRDGSFSFEAIAGNSDKNIKNSLLLTQQKYGITSKHINLMNYLKDCGDYTAHSDRPFLTKNEWMEILLSDEDEDESYDSVDAQSAALAVNLKSDLLSALEKFFPSPGDGVLWEIVDYTERKKKVPVLNLVDRK